MYDTESWTENVPRQLRCFSISCHSMRGAQATCTGSCFRSVGVRHVSQRVRCHVRGTSFACRVAFSSHFFNIARQLTVFFPPTHRLRSFSAVHERCVGASSRRVGKRAYRQKQALRVAVHSAARPRVAVHRTPRGTTGKASRAHRGHEGQEGKVESRHPRQS